MARGRYDLTGASRVTLCLLALRQRHVTTNARRSAGHGAEGRDEAIQAVVRHGIPLLIASFSPVEIAELVRTNSLNINASRVESLRQTACGFIDRVGGHLGFPRRTIATAQILYHRFHLHFPLADFAYQDVCIASLLVAAKLEDTLKKLREIQTAAHVVTVLLEGGKGSLEPDPHQVDADRGRLIGIERLMLETISFNFNLRLANESSDAGGSGKDVFSYVVKIGKHIAASPALIKLAFRVAIDAHRTLMPLSHPPHVIAAASLYLAAQLALPTSPIDDSPADATADAAIFGPGWEESLHCDHVDIDDICHALLDVLLVISPYRPAGSTTSPNEFLSPAESSGSSSSAVINVDFTQVKIRLREQERRRGSPTKGKRNDGSTDMGLEFLGRDDVSVRFKWGDTPER